MPIEPAFGALLKARKCPVTLTYCLEIIFRHCGHCSQWPVSGGAKRFWFTGIESSGWPRHTMWIIMSWPTITMIQHYSDVIMSTMVSQINRLTIVHSSIYSGADQRTHQSSASIAFVRGNSPVTSEFPAQRASNVENDFIWWRHHGVSNKGLGVLPSPHPLVYQTVYFLCVCHHYDDVIMTTMASQITSLTIVYSTVYSGTDQRKHQSSASLAFVRGIHRGQHKWPVTRKMFPFDDVIMILKLLEQIQATSHTEITCSHIMSTKDWLQHVQTPNKVGSNNFVCV